MSARAGRRLVVKIHPFEELLVHRLRSFTTKGSVKSSFKRRGKRVKASLMLVNRIQRRKKFLELAIWEVFTEGKAA